MQVKEWQNDIVFLHKVGAGAASRSYGVHVAKLAGLPDQVINRAQHILKLLETSNLDNNLQQKTTTQLEHLPLFLKQPQQRPLNQQISPLILP